MPPSRIRRYLRNGRLSQLAVFEASARHGCYTRAARELHLAQPTVSAQIKKLAEALGSPLFEQVGKRMHPTEAGRYLQAACVEVFGTLSRLEEALARLRPLDTGRLALAASRSGERAASRLVARFVRHHPHLEVALHIDDDQELVERMGRGEDDLYHFGGLCLVHPVGKAPGPAARAFLEFARREPRQSSAAITSAARAAPTPTGTP